MLAQKLVLSYSSKILLQFIQIAASIIVARIAGPSVLGTLSFGLAYVSMFSFIASLGLGSAHIKLVSEGRDLGNCISTYSRLVTFTITLYFVVTLSFFAAQKYIFHVQFESLTHQYVILILLVSMTIQSFFAIPNMTFAGRTEQAKQDIPQIIKTVILQVLRIIVVLMGYKALSLAFSNLISVMLIIPIIWYLFKDYPRGIYDKELAKEYIKIALPMITLGISATLIRTLDKVMLQFFYDSKEVGYYTAGYRIGGFVNMIALSAGMLFFPVFSKKFAKGNIEGIKEIIDKFERFSFLFIMPVVIFAALYSDSIVMFVLGDKYVPSIPILSIITISMFVLLTNTPYGNLVVGMGYFRLAAIVNLIKVLIFVGLLYIFLNPNIMNLGALGVAYSILIINILLWIVNKVFIKLKVKSFNIAHNFKFIVFGVINYIAFYYFYNHFKEVYNLTFRIIFPFIYFSVTYSILILLKWIDKNDWKMLFSIFDIKKMKSYIGVEIKLKKK